MASDTLTKAFAAAAEVVKNLPKHLHEVAFNRALDHLLGRDRTSGVDVGRSRKRKSEPSDDDSTALLNLIDRTRYPDIGATTRVADRALKVLQLAHDDHGVDGLTAAVISEILTKRFRLPATPNAVNTALERETNTVDIRQSKDGVKTFHLMAPGEDYLRELRAGKSLEAKGKNRKTKPDRSAKTTRSKRVPAESREREDLPPKRSKGSSAKRHGSRPGPKAAVEQLVSAGFFKTSRTISNVQNELKHKRGHSYSLQDLAPAMVRSLRDGTLTRERNESGQYEYRKA